MKTNNKRYSFLIILQIFSIDVVLGTITIGYLATKLLNVEANPYWWVILPLSVWVVYSIDHVIDSLKNKNIAVIYRHRFHYLHRKPIIIMIVIAALTSVILSILYLDYQIIRMGLALSAFIASYFALMYFLLQKQSIFLQKELIIAIVYTTGIFMAPLFWSNQLPSFPIIIVLFIIFMLAWLEGIMISWFDFDNDIKDGHISFTVIAGKRNTRYFLILGHMLIEIVTIILLILVPLNIIFWTLLILLVMNLLLGLVILFPDSFYKNSYYRFIGETVFILPILIIFV